jgi:nickel/cobalt transporter (NiCoT) family protein
MQEGKRPVSVGLLFSLGHSTIVVVGSAAIAATALALHHRIDTIKSIGGLLARLFRPMFRMITRSWHMYPLGILFGLGFDTEIGVLGMSATEASKGLSLWSILVFPALFAAGMSLVDTTDSLLMLGAMAGPVKPIRKLYTTSPSPGIGCGRLRSRRDRSTRVIG